MTTNGDEDVPVTNGDMPSAGGHTEGGIHVTSCDKCRELEEVRFPLTLTP